MVRALHKSRAVRTVAAVIAAAAFFGLAALLAGQATGVQSHSPVAVASSGGPTTGASPIFSLPNAKSGTGPSPATTTTTLAPLGTKVAIVGDSLTEGIITRLPALEPRYGFQAKIDAQTGRGIDAGLASLKKIMPGQDLVVVALGTNDAHNGLSATDADALIDKMMTEIGPKPVLWVNIYRSDTKGTTTAAQLFDTQLTAATSRYANLTVLDWASYIQSRPELMGGDHIHLTSPGYDARAEWLARQITEGLRLPLPDVPELSR